MLSFLKDKMLVLAAALLLLGGCKEVLYSDLTEAEANEMMALLVLSGIPADRERDPTAGYSLLVDEDNLAVAVTILKNSDLPREKFVTMGDVFGDVGVVGTPFEERIRFSFATNQELSQTISQIKGVDSARVHTVIPPQERFGTNKEPASASVVIFHDPSFNPAEYTAQIKALVAFAVPGLEIENISSTFFKSPGFVVQPAEPAISINSLSAEASSATPAPVTGQARQSNSVLGIVLLLLVLLVVRMVTLFFRRLKNVGAIKKRRRYFA